MEDKILCNVSDLEPIADAVREKENTNKLYSVEELKVKVPELIGSGSGIELPVLTNPAIASDALSGKEFINGDGNKVTGTIATKTSSNLTASGATVTVPAGYYASQVTKSVATATQATPSVSIDTSGKITASSTQSAGYVAAGTKTATKQLTVQAAKTVTPSTNSQTAVASGVYTTGAVTVAAIPSQYQDITTPLSDLNAANGGTAATTIGAAVDNTEAHASSQEALIAQIAEALEGKAIGGNGSNIETYTVNMSIEKNAYYNDGYIYYCNANGELVEERLYTTADFNGTITMPKGLLVLTASFDSGALHYCTTMSGNIEWTNFINSAVCVFMVYGDCSLAMTSASG